MGGESLLLQVVHGSQNIPFLVEACGEEAALGLPVSPEIKHQHVVTGFVEVRHLWRRSTYSYPLNSASATRNSLLPRGNTSVGPALVSVIELAFLGRLRFASAPPAIATAFYSSSW